MKSDKTHVYLWVTNFGQDAAVVTELIGLEPSYIEIPGQPRPHPSKMVGRRHCWELHSPLPLTAHIDDHFDALLHLLEPHAAAISNVSTVFKAGINAAVYYYKDFQPGIHLSAHAVKVLAAMNLSVDFDLYFIGEKGDE